MLNHLRKCQCPARRPPRHAMPASHRYMYPSKKPGTMPPSRRQQRASTARPLQLPLPLEPPTLVPVRGLCRGLSPSSTPRSVLRAITQLKLAVREILEMAETLLFPRDSSRSTQASASVNTTARSGTPRRIPCRWVICSSPQAESGRRVSSQHPRRLFACGPQHKKKRTSTGP